MTQTIQPPKLKPYKAYKVHCMNDDHGAEISFAERAVDLKGSRVDECDCVYLDLRVRRAPEFDKYWGTRISIENYLAEGWQWECSGCGHQVWQDDAFVTVGGAHVYCCVACLVTRYRRDIERALPTGPAPNDCLHESCYAHIGAMVIRLMQLGKITPPYLAAE
jgi:hypothetical protein